MNQQGFAPSSWSFTLPIMTHEPDCDFCFHVLVRRPCPKRIFFASSVIPAGAGLIVFANAYARWTASRR
jgi:hypothetical protein